MTVQELKDAAGSEPKEAGVNVQSESCKQRTTRSGKPYLELTFVDATGGMVLKAWDNHPQFSHFQSLKPQSFLKLEGSWTKNQYGLDANSWSARPLNSEEKADFLSGDPATRKVQSRDWQFITETLGAINEPRLKAIGQAFLAKYADPFRRAAAARRNHHARRGGLVEHTAQMMRAADGMKSAYPDLNVELMHIGILFHDCGKIYENGYKADSFAQTVDLRGEMLGHISIGMELFSQLWKELLEGVESSRWIELDVPSEHVRLHVLHLIASHHGQMEFGSPVLPRTPEAFAIHHIDNFDAKFEMLKEVYKGGSELAPGIYDRVFPLPGNPIEPLPSYKETPTKPPEEQAHEADVLKSDFLF